MILLPQSQVEGLVIRVVFSLFNLFSEAVLNFKVLFQMRFENAKYFIPIYFVFQNLDVAYCYGRTLIFY